MLKVNFADMEALFKEGGLVCGEVSLAFPVSFAEPFFPEWVCGLGECFPPFLDPFGLVGVCLGFLGEGLLGRSGERFGLGGVPILGGLWVLVMLIVLVLMGMAEEGWRTGGGKHLDYE